MFSSAAQRTVPEATRGTASDALPPGTFFPCDGEAIRNDGLDVFLGESPFGTWALGVRDSAEADFGGFDSWGVAVQYE